MRRYGVTARHTATREFKVRFLAMPLLFLITLLQDESI